MREPETLIVGDPTTGAIVAVVTGEPAARRGAVPTVLRPAGWLVGAAALAGLFALANGIAQLAPHV